ncbi:MAG: histidine--tRNA ligase [Defluviitaleaceae bacterium]|nr:histidine--tRNA ligase [Defluviitaleaceae bacterium]
MRINTTPPSGFLELTPSLQLEFEKLKKIIEETYQMYGFTPLDTPLIERSSTLLAKGSEETDNQIYFVKNKNSKEENELALRFDLTVPLARYVANNINNLTFPFKRSHIGKVYRGERSQAGRFREFYQCDIDIIGKENLSIHYDAEIPSIIYQIFKKMDIGKFKIKINNRKILNGLFEEIGLTVPFSKVLAIIDKSEKITKSELVNEFYKLEIEENQIKNLENFMCIKGDVKNVIEKLKDLPIKNYIFNQGIEELEIVTNTMIMLNVPPSYFEIDLSIVRGLDYYTGTVYETIMEDNNIGSVCSGGRYDNLLENYSENLPGVGISIGLSRLFYCLKESGIIKERKKTIADVIIITNNKENIKTGIETANTLRTNNINVDFLFEDMKIKKKYAYIDKLNTPFVIVVKDIDEKEVLSLQYRKNGNLEKEILTMNQILKIISDELKI